MHKNVPWVKRSFLDGCAIGKMARDDGQWLVTGDSINTPLVWVKAKSKRSNMLCSFPATPLNIQSSPLLIP